VNILIACEFSGVVRSAFRARGHRAWSCDLLPAEDESPYHLQGDVRQWLNRKWDLLIAHPPCTYLTRSGWHWVNRPDSATLPLKGEPRRQAMFEAATFFRLLLAARIPQIAIENPRPITHAQLPHPTQVIQPWQFGHGEIKATCLWLKNLPPLSPTQVVEGRQSRVHKEPPHPDRWKRRSRTYEGIAAAMAEQWG
jgi:hypothetical protein